MKDELNIIPVTTVDEVLSHALTGKLTPIEWSEPVESAPPSETEGPDAVVTH